MAEYKTCPTCQNPLPEGEVCGFCEATRAAEEQKNAPEVSAEEAAVTTPEVLSPVSLPEKETASHLYIPADAKSPAPAPAGDEYEKLMKKTYATMSSLSVFGTLLLFFVPVIGLFFAVAFAFGAGKKKQKVLLARGFLLFVLVALLLVALGILLFALCCPACFEGLLNTTLSEDAVTALKCALPFLFLS